MRIGCARFLLRFGQDLREQPSMSMSMSCMFSPGSPPLSAVGRTAFAVLRFTARLCRKLRLETSGDVFSLHLPTFEFGHKRAHVFHLALQLSNPLLSSLWRHIFPPERSKAVKSAALVATSSTSTRGGGWAPTSWVSPWECRAAQSRQAYPEEAQEPSWGTAKGAL